MDLVFFDLDGTLLNKASQISAYTRDTLDLLAQKNIAFTVATGRAMHSAQHVLQGVAFTLPHIYNNGVTIWDPADNKVRLDNLLAPEEVNRVLSCASQYGVTPFINTIGLKNHKHEHIIYHAQPRHRVESDLVDKYFSRTKAILESVDNFPLHAHVTNISMIGEAEVIRRIYREVIQHQGIIAYSGPAIEGEEFRWIDVHHTLANKGSAVQLLKSQLGADNVICFGDSDNDISMFKLADEAYAPDNAKQIVKDNATAVIGHHDNDGIAHFLRARFEL